jgi:hypothetical protein
MRSSDAHFLLSTTRPPSALFVCRESRNLALSHFERLELEQSRRLLPEYIFFRLTIDVLFLDIQNDEFYIAAEMYEKITQIQTVAISQRGLRGGYDSF